MCTNFKHQQAADGSVAVGRTMEFPDVLPWQLSVLAADFAGASTAVTGGRTWTAKYGVVGIGAFEPQWLADGTNTAGLSAHLLYMPDHCTFASPRHDGSDIGVIETLAFLLGTCGDSVRWFPTFVRCQSRNGAFVATCTGLSETTMPSAWNSTTAQLVAS
jgi:choloylglycine hydrolase